MLACVCIPNRRTRPDQAKAIARSLGCAQPHHLSALGIGTRGLPAKLEARARASARAKGATGRGVRVKGKGGSAGKGRVDGGGGRGGRRSDRSAPSYMYEDDGQGVQDGGQEEGHGSGSGYGYGRLLVKHDEGRVRAALAAAASSAGGGGGGGCSGGGDGTRAGRLRSHMRGRYDKG